MINEEQILRNARKLRENGLEKETLDRAKGIFAKSREEITETFNRCALRTHLNPETIGVYLTLFDGNLNGKNFLDLGCGAGQYSPILSYVMKDLGANVVSVDTERSGTKEYFDKKGITLKNINLTHPWEVNWLKDPNIKFDIISARSLLNNGLNNDDGDHEDFMRPGYDMNEFKIYKNMIFQIKKNNNQKALYELDSFIPVSLAKQKQESLNLDFTKATQEVIKEHFCEVICYPSKAFVLM